MTAAHRPDGKRRLTAPGFAVAMLVGVGYLVPFILLVAGGTPSTPPEAGVVLEASRPVGGAVPEAPLAPGGRATGPGGRTLDPRGMRVAARPAGCSDSPPREEHAPGS